jgi:glycosyltransferase involved in cell wall biosynthesis
MFRPSVPTHIYVNGKFLTQATTGVQRYARETLDAIDASLNSQCTLTWTVLAPRGAGSRAPWKHIELREVGSLSGHAWEQLELPRYASNGWLLTLCGAPSVLHRAHFFAIHDAALYDMPEGYGLVYRTFYRFLYALSVNRSRAVFTVSDFSQKRLASLFPRVADRIVNTYCGADHSAPRISASHREPSIPNLPSQPYVLAVSSLAPNKNVKVVAALSNLLAATDLQIAVVGGTNSNVFSPSKLKSSTILQMGYVNDRTLEDLYRNAACFIFPSLYEGFGLPPIEAMSFGCPVIASNATSIPEICGNAALYFDPTSVEELNSQLQRLLHEPKLAEALTDLGFIQSRKYTWNHVAQTILKTIESLI